ncbi:MAG: response regulator transcription factor [Chloroflexota bacterium]
MQEPTVMVHSLESQPNTHVSEHCIVVVVDASRGANILDQILRLVEELTAVPLPGTLPSDQTQQVSGITDELHTRLPRGAGLTPREREVVELVVHGYSNKMIAESLVITERTAETHVRNIREKLGFSSRSQVAAWGMRRLLLGKP